MNRIGVCWFSSEDIAEPPANIASWSRYQSGSPLANALGGDNRTIAVWAIVSLGVDIQDETNAVENHQQKNQSRCYAHNFIVAIYPGQMAEFFLGIRSAKSRIKIMIHFGMVIVLLIFRYSTLLSIISREQMFDAR